MSITNEEFLDNIREKRLIIAKRLCKNEDIKYKVCKFFNEDIVMKDIYPRILHEDENYFYVYKPPFWEVSVDDTESTDIEKNPRKHLLVFFQWTTTKLPKYDLQFSHKYQYGAIHRLDVETSGLLIIAKNLKAYLEGRKNVSVFHNNKKYYLALVHGHVKDLEQMINANIVCKKHYHQMTCEGTDEECKFNRDKNEICRAAKTKTNVVQYYEDDKGNKYTLMLVKIYTGMTHQIRVHHKYIGHPLVNDYKYNIKNIKNDETLVPRNFLHAYYYLIKGLDDNEIKIKVPLPSDLEGCLKKLNPIGKKIINIDKVIENDKEDQSDVTKQTYSKFTNKKKFFKKNKFTKNYSKKFTKNYSKKNYSNKIFNKTIKKKLY
jgi:23S rRNA-/tRNA-specific pseudouridylate synthase